MADEWENLVAARAAKISATAQLQPYFEAVGAANAALLRWAKANKPEGGWPRDKDGARVIPADLWLARANAIDALTAAQKAIGYDAIGKRLEEAWLDYSSADTFIRVLGPDGQEIRSEPNS